MNKLEVNRVKNTSRNILTGILNRIVSLFIPFIIRSIIIKELGVEYLGLSSLFISILQILSLTELGFGSAMVYMMYKPVANENRELIGKILHTYRKIYRIIGLVVIFVGILLMPFLKYIIDFDEVSGINVNVYILYSIYLLNTAVSYLMFAYKKSLLMAYQRNFVINIINLVTKFLLYTLQIVILLTIQDYYIYIILLPIFTIVDNVITNVVVNRIFPNIKPIGDLDVRYKNDLKDRVKALAGHKIGAIVLVSLDNIIISAFISLRVLTIYNNYYYVITALVGFMNIGYNAILAGVGNSLITQSKDKNYRLFRELTFINSWVVGFITIMLIVLYQPFMFYWMGENLMFDMSVIWFLAAYFYFWQIRIIGLNFKDAAGMWKADFWKPYIGLFVNLVVNIILVQIIGIYGVLITTIFVMIIIYFPFETRVLFKNLFERRPRMYIMSQIKYFILTFSSILIVHFLLDLNEDYSLTNIIMNIVISFLVYSMIFLLFTFRDKEFLDAKNRFMFLYRRYFKRKG